jgi:hypothetical protein
MTAGAAKPRSESMQSLFPLGQVKIVPPAAALMARAGQDAEFFLQMHVSGLWSDEHVDLNKQSLQTGSVIINKYRTLLGDAITVVTFPDRRLTGVFGDSQKPSFHYYGYTYDPGPACGYTPSYSDSTTLASTDEASLSTLGVFGAIAASPPADQSNAAADDYADNLPQSNVPAFSPVDTDSLCVPSDGEEPNPQDNPLGYQFGYYPIFTDPFEPRGYVPNMMYDAQVSVSLDTSTTTDGSTDTPPDVE